MGEESEEESCPCLSVLLEDEVEDEDEEEEEDSAIVFNFLNPTIFPPPICFVVGAFTFVVLFVVILELVEPKEVVRLRERAK